MAKIYDISGTLNNFFTRYRSLDRIKHYTIHRTGLDLKWGHNFGETAKDICNVFLGNNDDYKDVPKATNYQIPYTFIIGGDSGSSKYDGKIWQCASLNIVTPHSRQFSIPGLGIALIGDFRYYAPSKAQYKALELLIVYLNKTLGRELKMVKHGDIAKSHDGSKASGEPNACPGDYFDFIHQ